MASSANQSREPDMEYGAAYAPPSILPEKTSTEETKAVIDDRNTELWMDEKRAKAAPEPLTRFERWWEYGAEGAGGAASDDPDAPQGDGGAPPSLPEGAGGYGGGSAVDNDEVHKDTGPTPGAPMNEFSEEEQNRLLLEDLAKDQPKPGPKVAQRMGVAWGAFPPELRPQILAGGLPVYGQSDGRVYAADVGRAVAAGKINPQQGDAALRAYVKWQKSQWGSKVHLFRKNKEYEWLGHEAKADLAALGSEAARKQQAIHEEELDDARERQLEYEEYRERYERDLTATLSKQDAAIDELAKTEIDPNRWYNSKDTGGKILAVLAMGLGNLGSSLSKSPNYTFHLIKSQMDADIKAQAEAIRSKRGAINARTGLVGQLNQRFNNLHQSVKVARLMMTDQTIAKTRSLAANLRSETQRRNYFLLMKQLEKDRERASAQVNSMAADMAAARARAAMAARRRHQGPMRLSKKFREALAWRIPGKDGKSHQVKIVGLTTDGAKKRFRDEVSGVAEMNQILGQIKAIRGKYGGNVSELVRSGQDAKRLATLGHRLMNLARVIKGAGANFTEVEQKMIEKDWGLEDFKSGFGNRIKNFAEMMWVGRKGPGGELYMPLTSAVSSAKNVLNQKYGDLMVVPIEYGMTTQGGTLDIGATGVGEPMRLFGHMFPDDKLTPVK